MVSRCQGPARGTARVGRGRRRSRRGGRRPPRDLSCPVHYQRAGESMTSLDSALAHVDASTFTLQADGTPLPQTSAPGIITALLRLLDVWPVALHAWVEVDGVPVGEAADPRGTYHVLFTISEQGNQ